MHNSSASFNSSGIIFVNAQNLVEESIQVKYKAIRTSSCRVLPQHFEHLLRMFLCGLGLPAIRFHDLRATWATLLLSKGVEPIKVMIMGGWKDLKTMQIYVRKAGVDIAGATDCLDFHNGSPKLKQEAQPPSWP